MTNLTAADLSARVAALTNDLTLIDEERGKLSILAEEGAEVAMRSISDLGVERAAVAGKLEQARMALQQAQQREEAAEREAAQRHLADHVKTVREHAEAMRSEVARFDTQLADLARTLVRISDHRDALQGACGGVTFNDPIAMFTSRVESHVNSALATRGFGFKHMPFVAKDINGRSDLGSLALLPHVPGVSYFETAAEAAYHRQHGTMPRPAA